MEPTNPKNASTCSSLLGTARRAPTVVGFAALHPPYRWALFVAPWLLSRRTIRCHSCGNATQSLGLWPFDIV